MIGIAGLKKLVREAQDNQQRNVGFLKKLSGKRYEVTLNGEGRRFKSKEKACQAVQNTTLIKTRLHQPKGKQARLLKEFSQ